ncbi:sugar fermentation stimulation protein A [Sinobacterium caligoides]|uniref:Sugar fermentation stimulation protein homolog n=1 Tax=Sinobacterium caligoides TaxID=933926 RepID=A0A3N2DFQ0_9GAMM|nr:DNA/RNA nuclease SfsA [Sinobacterium caligoides]ROR98625.1 sugar fermentation stimulation protein A [Sinobacterium caligoides]
MQLEPMIEGRLIRRYKRFLADVVLLDGREVTAHCPNTGKMTGCAEPGERVWLSVSDNPKRKYPHGWVLAELAGEHLACVHSAFANTLVEEAVAAGRIEALSGYETLRREVRYGEEKSRIDLLLSDPARADCYVEVKSVTLLMEAGVGMFPDAVSDRGRRHLRELQRAVEEGHRAVLLFCVQHSGIHSVCGAEHVDPAYCQALAEAIAGGVEVLAYGCEITLDHINLLYPLPFMVPT